MKPIFIKIQEKRYRLTTLKMCEPFKDAEAHGVYVYFSVIGRSDRRYHRFKTKSEGDKLLNKLDELFNIQY